MASWVSYSLIWITRQQILWAVVHRLYIYIQSCPYVQGSEEPKMASPGTTTMSALRAQTPRDLVSVFIFGLHIESKNGIQRLTSTPSDCTGCQYVQLGPLWMPKKKKTATSRPCCECSVFFFFLLKGSRGLTLLLIAYSRDCSSGFQILGFLNRRDGQEFTKTLSMLLLCWISFLSVWNSVASILFLEMWKKGEGVEEYVVVRHFLDGSLLFSSNGRRLKKPEKLVWLHADDSSWLYVLLMNEAVHPDPWVQRFAAGCLCMARYLAPVVLLGKTAHVRIYIHIPWPESWKNWRKKKKKAHQQTSLYFVIFWNVYDYDVAMIGDTSKILESVRRWRVDVPTLRNE
jgi:hypothetical protein